MRPSWPDEIDRQTGDVGQKQYGFAMSVSRLDQAFVQRMFHLTGLQVNLFSQAGLAAGTLPAYKAFTGPATPSPRAPGDWKHRQSR
jgi:hypothetical protein